MTPLVEQVGDVIVGRRSADGDGEAKGRRISRHILNTGQSTKYPMYRSTRMLKFALL